MNAQMDVHKNPSTFLKISCILAIQILRYLDSWGLEIAIALFKRAIDL